MIYSQGGKGHSSSTSAPFERQSARSSAWGHWVGEDKRVLVPSLPGPRTATSPTAEPRRERFPGRCSHPPAPPWVSRGAARGGGLSPTQPSKEQPSEFKAQVAKPFPFNCVTRLGKRAAWCSRGRVASRGSVAPLAGTRPACAVMFWRAEAIACVGQKFLASGTRPSLQWPGRGRCTSPHAFTETFLFFFIFFPSPLSLWSQSRGANSPLTLGRVGSRRPGAVAPGLGVAAVR